MLQADTASANWEQKWNTSLRINVTSTHNALSVDDDTDDLEDVTEELLQSQIADGQNDKLKCFNVNISDDDCITCSERHQEISSNQLQNGHSSKD